ncbi:2'-5' RNA ligase family protein [Hoyosella sp. YIM 151337]|uniref:2'-5' RNA ligase family protein n=1 Tax=Hoyosella sp. YIM 151337 TaxID=2992742 RepID=UPI0022367374|nr:2'-5' RNA ligase family protein [Hoyosella sp. YIM 151337]MCW4356051.1 2'-5' RNA ligase family protein [Hoyosella sp. YIM 151337]
MALAVCLLFDPDSDRAVRQLWRRAEELGLPTLLSHTHGQHHAHLSYVVLLEWEQRKVEMALDTLERRGPFTLWFDAVGVMRRGRVCLMPAPTSDLAARQTAVLDAVESTGALVHKHYARGRWLPHLSIVTRAARDRVPAVSHVLFDVLPLQLTVAGTALIDSATGRMWRLRGVL